MNIKWWKNSYFYGMLWESIVLLQQVLVDTPLLAWLHPGVPLHSNFIIHGLIYWYIQWLQHFVIPPGIMTKSEFIFCMTLLMDSIRSIKSTSLAAEGFLVVEILLTHPYGLLREFTYLIEYPWTLITSYYCSQNSIVM